MADRLFSSPSSSSPSPEGSLLLNRDRPESSSSPSPEGSSPQNEHRAASSSPATERALIPSNMDRSSTESRVICVHTPPPPVPSAPSDLDLKKLRAYLYLSSGPGAQQPFRILPGVPYDKEMRVKHLKHLLDDDEFGFWTGRHASIKAVIEYVQSPNFNKDKRVYFVEGKQVSEEFFNKSMRCRDKYQYGGFAHQFAQFTYTLAPHFHCHEVKMKLRLIPELGGDGREIPLSVLNDTGSSVLSVFEEDLTQLGLPSPAYDGSLGMVEVYTADGVGDQFEAFRVQVAFVEPHGQLQSHWIEEEAIARKNTGNIPRLSGRGVRYYMSHATSRGNLRLEVS